MILNYIDDHDDDYIVVGEEKNKQLTYEVSLHKQVDDDTDDEYDDTGPVINDHTICRTFIF